MEYLSINLMEGRLHTDGSRTDDVTERMAEAMREATALNGACTEADLKLAGFTTAQIIEHQEDAARLARLRWVEHAPRPNPVICVVTAARGEIESMRDAAQDLVARADALSRQMIPARFGVSG